MNSAILCKNLQNLMKIHGGLSVSELARQTHVPQPTLHHILDGTTKNPRKKALGALASFFSITIQQLVGDVPLPPTIPDSIKTSLNITTVPIIEWTDIKQYGQTKVKPFYQKEVILDKSIDKYSFAVVMNNRTLEPMFPENSILIFDPSKSPKDRDFALAYLTNKDTVIFNRYFMDGTASYIKEDQNDGNAQLIKLKTEDKVIATLVEVRLQF